MLLGACDLREYGCSARYRLLYLRTHFKCQYFLHISFHFTTRALHKNSDFHLQRPVKSRFCLFMSRQPPSGAGPPHSREFYTTHDAPQSVGLLWTSDQPVAETSPWQHTQNTHKRHTSMLPLGFETTISAGERPQTYALYRAATGTGRLRLGA